jgi:DNA repair protein RadC
LERDKLNIKSWAEEDRPREKFSLKGKNALSDAELIAILIGSGSKTLTAVELAKQILNSVDNDLNRLAKLNIPELMKYKGMGEAKSITIAAALELGRRRKESDKNTVPTLKSSHEVYEYIKPYLQDLSHEEMWLISMNRAMKPKNMHKVGMGGVGSVAADVKIILKKALEDLATSIIIIHNHPSGQLFPSKHDINFTSQLKAACFMLDITLSDHLIFTDSGYFSFSDHNEL